MQILPMPIVRMHYVAPNTSVFAAGIDGAKLLLKSKHTWAACKRALQQQHTRGQVDMFTPQTNNQAQTLG